MRTSWFLCCRCWPILWVGFSFALSGVTKNEAADLVDGSEVLHQLLLIWKIHEHVSKTYFVFYRISYLPCVFYSQISEPSTVFKSWPKFGSVFFKHRTTNMHSMHQPTCGSKDFCLPCVYDIHIAGWKMGAPDWLDVFPIKKWWYSSHRYVIVYQKGSRCLRCLRFTMCQAKVPFIPFLFKGSKWLGIL